MHAPLVEVDHVVGLRAEVEGVRDEQPRLPAQQPHDGLHNRPFRKHELAGYLTLYLVT